MSLADLLIYSDISYCHIDAVTVRLNLFKKLTHTLTNTQREQSESYIDKQLLKQTQKVKVVHRLKA